jgi:hypothetical protein
LVIASVFRSDIPLAWMTRAYLVFGSQEAHFIPTSSKENTDFWTERNKLEIRNIQSLAAFGLLILFYLQTNLPFLRIIGLL